MAAELARITGKYEILEKIREGGMGAVYKVRHRLLGDVRVVKVMRPQLAQDPSLRKRFHREAKAVIRLSHPNIAQLYDFTVDDEGTAYIVMEFIPGLTLDELIDRGQLPPLGLALEIADQSLAAIGHIHRHGMIHRDVSPDNLMLTRDVDGRAAVKLIDLGLAKLAETTGELTASGVFLGKFRYASPEQFDADGEARLGPASDLYSFGLVLYELLTGKFPIVGNNPSSLIAGHLFRPPLHFADSDPHGRIPIDLRQLVSRALAKNQRDRFASAESFAAALAPIRQRYDPSSPEAEQILVLTQEARRRERSGARSSPGSTQSRFDRQFGAEMAVAGDEAEDAEPTRPTSHPPAMPPLRPRAADSTIEEAPAAAVADLAEVVEEIEELIAGGHFETAWLELAQAAGSWGERPELRELGERLAETEQIAHRPQVLQLLREARQEAGRNNFPAALAALAKASELAPDDEQVEALRRETQQTARRHESELAAERQRQRDEEISRLLRQADQLASGYQHDQALELLDQALALDPDNSAVHEERERVVEVLRRTRDRRLRDHEMRQAGKKIDDLIAAGDLGQAAVALEVADKMWGRAAGEAFAPQRERLTAAKRQHDQGRQAEVLAGEADALRRADRIEEALAKAREARDLAPLNKMAQLLVLDVEEKMAERRRTAEHLEAKRRAEAEIRELLAQGAVDEAARRLPEALDVAGPTLVLKSLQEQVERELAPARPESESASRREADELVAKARSQARSEHFAAADQLLRAALELCPDHPEGLALAVSVETCRKLQDEEIEVRAEVDRTVGAIRRRLDEGEIDAALRDLELATRRFGDHRELRELRYEAAEVQLEKASATETAPQRSEPPAAAPAASAVAHPEDEAPTVGLAPDELPTARLQIDEMPVVDQAAAESAAAEPASPPPAADDDVPTVEMPPASAAEAPPAAPAAVAPSESPTLPAIAATGRSAGGAAAAGRSFDEISLRMQAQSVLPEGMTDLALSGGPPPQEAPREQPPPATWDAGSGEPRELGWRTPADPSPGPQGLPAPTRPAPPLDHSNWGMVVVAVVVIVVFVLLGLYLRHMNRRDEKAELPVEDVAAAELATGAVAVDARPWAEIARIVDQAGREHTPRPSSHTPVLLALPPGQYRLTLVHPPTRKSEEIDVEVRAGERVRRQVRFEELDGRQYFRSIGW